MEIVQTAMDEKHPLIVKGKPIWERLFFVDIANKHLLHEQEIRAFGTMTSGDDDYDNQMYNDTTTVMITIDAMVEYFKSGTPIKIVKHEDTKVIYDIIHDYLVVWEARMTKGINVGHVPADDLKALDMFAGALHPHASNYIKADDSARSIISVLGGDANAWFGRGTFTPVKKPDDYKVEPYNSFKDIITEHVSKKLHVFNPGGKP